LYAKPDSGQTRRGRRGNAKCGLDRAKRES
jgi:hypothetical protein